MDEPRRSGRYRQLRVHISVAMTMAPSWWIRDLTHKSPAKSTAAKAQLVEHIAAAIEERFTVTWRGSTDENPDAIEPAAPSGPLFGP